MDADSKHKIFIWVKLRDGSFSPNTTPHRAGSNVTNKKRGAPTSGGSGDLWGWAPGYYCATNGGDAGGDSKEGEGNGTYHITLFDLNKSGLDTQEHEVPESSATKLLESGDIVLANPWEGLDFMNRMGVSEIDGDGEESDYDYDDDSDSDEADDGAMNHDKKISGILDSPDEAPPSNLIELTHLHEPSVVHALRQRFENTSVDMTNIYTDTGPILLAVNPFKRDSTGMLYGPETIDKYRLEGEANWRKERKVQGGGGGGEGDMGGDDEDKPLPPHVYAVADRTFRTMMTRMHPPLDAASIDKKTEVKINQSILVSGESGAGKTVTTKFLMAYLSKLSENPDAPQAQDDDDDDANMSIEKRILESNPIMESFGNARTVRNDNSSRFGKYIEMKFLSQGGRYTMTPNSIPGATLAGASIETYLLEKVRLVYQSLGERNYHIFYELFSMRLGNNDDEEEGEEEGRTSVLEKIGLADYDMEDFRLINTSDTYDRRDGVPDSETFQDLKRAMVIMGFTSSERSAVFEVTCALLHMANLTFEKIGEVECALEMDNPHLEYVVDLLGITKEGLNAALCYYEITIGIGSKAETHKKVLSQEKAENGVEALIKATYGAMFNHLVKRINVSVAGDSGGGGEKKKTRRGASKKAASIGILDIFGFESFQVNSFEQLCINYCNESLQQQFNRFVLRNEQEEYDREGIPWNFIDFPENQEVLDLIDFKGTGILNILHDQCRTPGASDKTFAQRMYETCKSHVRFEADSRQVGQNLFGVHHYAGLVEYGVEGFVEKTRDELPKSGSDLLNSSSNDLVKAIAEILAPASASKGKKSGRAASQRPTVGVQFSQQLQSLRKKIDETSPHYVRCIKPNNLLVPDNFDAALIADQLRCAGVIEAVRVSRLGYPQRFSHTQFISRYQILGKKSKKKKDDKKFNPAKALVHSITKKLKDKTDDVGIQVGKTKVFLRRSAYDLLEKLRREQIASASVNIQKAARGYICRKVYVKSMNSVLVIQCFARNTLARIVVDERRRQYNSVIIQRTWRKYYARKMFLSAKVIAIWCQTHRRGAVGRQRYNGFNRDRNALILQSRWRGYLASKKFKQKRNASLTIQCATRCHSARVALKALKAEARDMGAVKQERDRLKKEAVAMQEELKRLKEIESKAGAVEDTSERDEEIQILHAAKEELSKEKEVSENELKALRDTLAELTKEKENTNNLLKEANETLDAIKSEREAIIVDRDDLKQMNKMLTTELSDREEDLQMTKEELKSLKKLTEETEDSKVVSTDTSQVVELKKNLKQVQEHRQSLLVHNDHLKDENRRNSIRVSSAAAISMDTSRMLELEAELEELKESNATLQDENNVLRAGNESTAVAPDDTSRVIDLETDLQHMKETNEALQNENDELKDNKSTQMPSEANSIGSGIQSLELQNDLRKLKETNAVLQNDNDKLKDENSVLLSKTEELATSIDDFKNENNKSTLHSSEIFADKKSVTIEEKIPGANVVPSVLTSFTADMDMSEEEITKLREENQILRNQLELLRVNQEFTSDDEDYDDSVDFDSESESASENIGIASDLPESVMKQICSEVEMVTEEVIMKTRAESESKIKKLQGKIEDLESELERSKRLAKYDLADMNRVNRGLHADLEAAEKETLDIQEELEARFDEYDALNEDVERFAETFAAQHDEMQQLEREIKKLKAENTKLKVLDAAKQQQIADLEAKKNGEMGSEIGKLWAELGRLKTSSSSVSSGPHKTDESVGSLPTSV